MSKITKIIARQIFDSRGNPTIEVEVFSNKISASAICPSGASTGSFAVSYTHLTLPTNREV